MPPLRIPQPMSAQAVESVLQRLEAEGRIPHSWIDWPWAKKARIAHTLFEAPELRGMLAALAGLDNPKATVTEANGVWTVSHPDRLTVTISRFQQAGGDISYDFIPPDGLNWESGVRGLLTSGHIARHTHREIVFEDGAGEDKDYLPTMQPNPYNESWRARRERLAEYGVIS